MPMAYHKISQTPLMMWSMSDAASTAGLSRELENSNSSNTLSDVRLDELVRLAESCATARETFALKDEYEQLDIAGTKLWNLATTAARDVEDNPSSMRQRVVRRM
jgi:hypothetical protein